MRSCGGKKGLLISIWYRDVQADNDYPVASWIFWYTCTNKFLATGCRALTCHKWQSHAENPLYVYEWRSEQEASLRKTKDAGMTDEQVIEFVNGCKHTYIHILTLIEAWKPRTLDFMSLSNLNLTDGRLPFLWALHRPLALGVIYWGRGSAAGAPGRQESKSEEGYGGVIGGSWRHESWICRKQVDVFRGSVLR